MAGIEQLDHLKIALKDIKLATNNFSEDKFIGKGGFGRVYKGQLNLHDECNTTEVAVKRLDANITGQGQREFFMEIFMLASYKHNNLASLIGFSDEDKEKVLIYKYEVNGSLDTYLDATYLVWEQRLRICLGAARGLEYLHYGAGTGHRVLHRDIKSSNILLDANWEAKISDFGLSKIGPTNQELTFLVTHAAGTPGYTDPQYRNTGVLTKESDVYSFGVVLFEVLCGRLAFAEYNDMRRFLSILAQRRYEEGKLDEIIMPSLREQMNPYSLEIFSKIAYDCLNKDRTQRPTMKSIVQALQMSLEFQTSCRNVTQSRLWGSSAGGGAWSCLFEGTQKLRKITIGHEQWIYSIRFTMEESSGLSNSSREYGGRSGGELSEIDFDDDEEIIEILGTVEGNPMPNTHHTTAAIGSLSFITNKKRQYGPFGKETDTTFSMQWKVGSFGGFYGRAGSFLDALGFYTKEITT